MLSQILMATQVNDQSTSVRKTFWLIVLAALALRLFVLSHIAVQVGLDRLLTIFPDSAHYFDGARSLVDGSEGFRIVAFSFGPGYPVFLAFFYAIFGAAALPICLAQVLLSSLSSGIVFLLGRRITGSNTTGTVAGALSAVSVTGTLLSCTLLSDTLYFFLFSLGLLLFLKGIGERRYGPCVVSGLLFGAATLTRTIGQFWPLAMIAIILAVKPSDRTDAKPPNRLRPKWRVGLIATAVVVFVEFLWIFRNVVVHGIPAMAFISASGPATIAALSQHPGDESNYRQTMDGWIAEYMTSHEVNSISPEDHFRLLRDKAGETFIAQPGAVIGAYTSLTWTNVNEIDHLNNDLLPQWRQFTLYVENFVLNYRLKYMWFILSAAGLCLSLTGRKGRQAVVLGICYGYYVALCGFFPWQGSRLFYQSEVASTILAAIVVVYVSQKVAPLFRGILNPK